MNRWNDYEIEILRNKYGNTSKEKLLNFLKNRTWRGVRRKAQRLSLKRGREQKDKMPSWFYGELASDRHIENNTGRYLHTTKYEDYAFFLKNKFLEEGIDCNVYNNSFFDKRTKKRYYRTIVQTKCIFKNIRLKWYFDGKKIIPRDLIIDDEYMFHFILGDGTIEKNGNALKLCTMDYDNDSIILFSELLRKYGVSPSILKDGNIAISKKGNKDFCNRILNIFEFPECYLYKKDRLFLWGI